MPTAIDINTRNCVIEYLNQGLPANKIAEIVGINKSTVGSIRKRYTSLPPHTTTRTATIYTDEVIADVLNKREAGLSWKEIAQLLNLNVKSLIVKISKYNHEHNSEKEKNSNETPVTEPIKENVAMSAKNDIVKNETVKNETRDNGLEISRSIKIKSKKTNNIYIVDSDSNIITLEFSNGQSVKMPIDICDKFADELVDVYIEVSDFMKANKKSR